MRKSQIEEIHRAAHPFCPKCESKNISCFGNYTCRDCQQMWEDDLYVLVEFPEDASYFEQEEIGYPCFNSGDNGARYVAEYEYILQFQKSPESNTYYKPVVWPESQKFMELPDNLHGLCELINDDKGLDDFGSSAFWVPLCLINSDDTKHPVDKVAKARSEHATLIAEVDADPDKWYELFVSEGDEGTHTVKSGDTFDEAVADYEKHAKEYGEGNVFLDVWGNRENPKQTQQINLL